MDTKRDGVSIPYAYLLATIVIVALLVFPTASSYFYNRTEKTDLYTQMAALGQENARLHQEAVELKKENDILNSYITLLYQNKLIPEGFPQVGVVSAEATPTSVTVPILIPTLPPVKLEFATPTATPFRG